MENDINGNYETFDEKKKAFYKDNSSEHIVNQNTSLKSLLN